MGKAFTLLELLITIAIIALLISIIVPVMSKARTYAKTQVCFNNLRQLASSIQMYVNDHKDYPDAAALNVCDLNLGLAIKIEPYINAPKPVIGESINPWCCPLDSSFYIAYGGSYKYCPNVYRFSYTPPVPAMFEAVPDLPLLIHHPYLGSLAHFVKIDTSVSETSAAINTPGIEWLRKHLR